MLLRRLRWSWSRGLLFGWVVFWGVLVVVGFGNPRRCWVKWGLATGG